MTLNSGQREGLTFRANVPKDMDSVINDELISEGITEIVDSNYKERKPFPLLEGGVPSFVDLTPS